MSNCSFGWTCATYADYKDWITAKYKFHDNKMVNSLQFLPSEHNTVKNTLGIWRLTAYSEGNGYSFEFNITTYSKFTIKHALVVVYVYIKPYKLSLS